MNFEKKHLPEFVLTNLFKEGLVIINEHNQVESKTSVSIEDKTTNTGINFLGDNKKNIILLVKEKDAVFISDEHYSFISNILAACKLNVADVAIVNCENTILSYTEINNQLQAKFVILFDITTSDIKLPFTIPSFQVQNYGGCKFLISPSLNNLTANSDEAKLLKSKLWICLKTMFEI